MRTNEAKAKDKIIAFSKHLDDYEVVLKIPRCWQLYSDHFVLALFWRFSVHYFNLFLATIGTRHFYFIKMKANVHAQQAAFRSLSWNINLFLKHYRSATTLAWRKASNHATEDLWGHHNVIYFILLPQKVRWSILTIVCLVVVLRLPVTEMPCIPQTTCTSVSLSSPLLKHS